MDRAAADAPSVGDVDPAAWLDRHDDLGRVPMPVFARRGAAATARWRARQG